MGMKPEVIRIEASGVADAVGLSTAPGAPAALLVEVDSVLQDRPIPSPWSCRVIAAGPANEISHHPAFAGTRVIRLPNAVVVPGLVNAHTHLDLTHIGPRPFDEVGGFSGWAMMVRSARAADAKGVRESVRAGAAKLIAGGVVAVGDIAGGGLHRVDPAEGPDSDTRLEAWRALEATGLLGVSFVECFGVGGWQEAAIQDMERLGTLAVESMKAGTGRGVRLGLQPHAPYSAGKRLYRAAADISKRSWAGEQRLLLKDGWRSDAIRVPVATHLAETLAEREFVQRGDGPFREMLEGIGRWDADAAGEVGGGTHPIAHVLKAMSLPESNSKGYHRGTALLAAHVNDYPDDLQHELAASDISVAYCPRGHAYFGHERTLGKHRYREMQVVGSNVCLATDSIVNLPPEQSDRLSPLDEARLLFARDGIAASALFTMITAKPAVALGLDLSWFVFRPGPVAGLLVVAVADTDPGLSPLERVMRASPARGGLGAELIDWREVEAWTRR